MPSALGSSRKSTCAFACVTSSSRLPKSSFSQQAVSLHGLHAAPPHTPAGVCARDRDPKARPVTALTTGLMGTYRRINDHQHKREEEASANENETDITVHAKHSRQCGRTHIEHSQDSLDFTHCVAQDEPMIGFSEHHHTPAAPAPSSLVPQFPSQLPQHGTINDDVATDDQCTLIEHSQQQDDWLVFSQLRVLVSQCSGFSGSNLNTPQ